MAMMQRRDDPLDSSFGACKFPVTYLWDYIKPQTESSRISRVHCELIDLSGPFSFIFRGNVDKVDTIRQSETTFKNFLETATFRKLF